MGADGHIDIFDYKKVVEHFGRDKIREFLAETINTYIRDIFGHKVMTGYYGDNIFDFWCGSIEEGDNKEHQEMLKWMEENAKIDTWEVWT